MRKNKFLVKDIFEFAYTVKGDTKEEVLENIADNGVAYKITCNTDSGYRFVKRIIEPLESK